MPRNSWLVFLAIMTAAGTALAGPADWPQWRGPASQGISQETKLPAEWSATKNIAWKTPLPGRGHSSPIVWGKKLFLTTSIEGDVVPGAAAVKHVFYDKEFLHPDSTGATRHQTLKVLCLDAETGKVLWDKTAFEGTVYDNRHKKNTYASPTPVTDGRRVFAFFESEGLYCYDFDGKLLWKKSLGGMGKAGMGPGTSPVLYRDLVILQCDLGMGDGSFIAAVEKKNGKEAWRTPRKVQSSWTTPIVVEGSSRDELITSGNEFIIAYDPASGKELWRSKGVGSNAIPTPVAGHDLVILSAGYPVKRVIAVRLGGAGDLTGTAKIAWTYDKGTAYVPSPILYGDYLYLTTDTGILTCLDARTGAVRYEGGRVPVPATFTASPVAFGGKILLTSEDGDTFVVQAGPQHSVIATNTVGEPVYASPAIAGGKIFIRGEKNLYCIQVATDK
ncbi:MAG: PQQ-binding-like beta-propeller repeat protein [Acidobacteriota bacterium]